MNLIVAVTKDYAIGNNNNLFFNLPKDLEFFKQKTTNKVVVMGKKTFLSLPRKPLPNRIIIVLSNNDNFFYENVIVVRSIKQLFEELKKYNSNDVFICGGASVYNLLMDYCENLYVTEIDKIVEADTYINNIEKKGYLLQDCSKVYKQNNISFCFKKYKNQNVKKFRDYKDI